MATIPIEDLERAINIWRSRHAAGSDGSLCEQARLLATPYALAIFEGRTSVELALLKTPEIDALTGALDMGAI